MNLHNQNCNCCHHIITANNQNFSHNNSFFNSFSSFQCQLRRRWVYRLPINSFYVACCIFLSWYHSAINFVFIRKHFLFLFLRSGFLIFAFFQRLAAINIPSFIFAAFTQVVKILSGIWIRIRSQMDCGDHKLTEMCLRLLIALLAGA